MSKQTSVQWLKDVLYAYLNKEDNEYTDVLFNKALEMETQQLIEAHNYGYFNALHNGITIEGGQDE